MKLKAAGRSVKSRGIYDSQTSTQISKEVGLTNIFKTSSAVALGQGIVLRYVKCLILCLKLFEHAKRVFIHWG